LSLCLTSLLTPFFFLLIRRPPSSPLFPYTTLFRSSASAPGAPTNAANSRSNARVLGPVVIHADLSVSTTSSISSCPITGIRGVRDRKSTRLNSSHVAISYAVFCLKKKKNRHHCH